MIESLQLLKELELREFNLNEDQRNRYSASAFVAGASIIFDAISADWYNQIDLARTRSETPATALSELEKFFTEETGGEPSWELKERLGFIPTVHASAKHLAAAWIEEISTRRMKRSARLFFNL